MNMLRINNERERFLSKDSCLRIFDEVVSSSSDNSASVVQIRTTWKSTVRWARNLIVNTSDMRNNNMTVTRSLNEASGKYSINQIDNDSIRNAVKYTEYFKQFSVEGDDFPGFNFEMPHLKPDIWDDEVYNLDIKTRNEIVQPLLNKSEESKMLSAGYIEIEAGGHAVISSSGLVRYYPYTKAQYSVTVREPTGNGSGWAGVDSSHWKPIDTDKITSVAIDKCLSSLNPVRVEPGRYTTILEPQAVANLFGIIAVHFDRRLNEERQDFPFYLSRGQSKIGLKLLDERMIVTSDVLDSDLGGVPFDWTGSPYLPVKWFDRGVLTDLAYNHSYAVKTLRVNEPLLDGQGIRINEGPTPLEEMISSTKRGILVTRFDRMTEVDKRSLLYTGFTRDGLWLVENGKITKAIKNFRFTESPLFVFNSIDQIGPSKRVFSPYLPMVAPCMKVRDFSFTSLTDAI